MKTRKHKSTIILHMILLLIVNLKFLIFLNEKKRVLKNGQKTYLILNLIN